MDGNSTQDADCRPADDVTESDGEYPSQDPNGRPFFKRRQIGAIINGPSDKPDSREPLANVVCQNIHGYVFTRLPCRIRILFPRGKPVTLSDNLETNQTIDDSVDDPWAIFDRIYCISLAVRTDRRQHAQNEFRRAGITRVEFFIVEKHPTNSEQGIFESHMACLRAGLADGARRMLVFEDDILFRRFSPVVLHDTAAFLKSNPECKIFFLGCFVNSSKKTAFRSVLRVRFRCLSHAYAVNKSFAQELAELPWRGTPFDDELRLRSEPQAFAVYPALAFQSGATTDNDRMLVVDRIRRLLGGVRVLQRWNEFSSHYLVPIVIVHVAIVLIVILGVFMLKRWR